MKESRNKINMLRLLIIALAGISLASSFSIHHSNGQRRSLASGAGGNSNNVRIQCEYKDKNGDSLVLNCTLLTSTLSQGLVFSDSLGVAVLNTGDTSSGSSGSSSLGSLKIGTNEKWRTPWESLSINHNIIHTLIMRNSRLRDLGRYAFKDLNYLEKVDLSFNKLSRLHADTFSHFAIDLLDLDLSHNQFDQIPSEIFRTSTRFQRLQSLRLNSNPIVHVHRRPFSYLQKSLKKLELNHCQIRSIDHLAFEGMQNLESISLIGNYIRYLHEPTFISLNLREFYVHENPLTCDCHMRWLINFMNNVAYQQKVHSGLEFNYNSVQPSAESSMQINPMWSSFQSNQKTRGSGDAPKKLSVDYAAQHLLKCEQPNSLKSRPNFLEINPDSFMCDVQIYLHSQKEDSMNHDENEFDDESGEEGETYSVGDEAVFICDVYGDPEPNVYWNFGQRPIEKGFNDDNKYEIHETRAVLLPPLLQSKTLSSADRRNTNKTSELRVKNLQATDVGTYSCTVEISGSTNRKQASMRIKRVRGLSSGAILSGSAKSIVASGVDALASATSSLFNHKLSTWTLLLLLAIMVSLLVFILLLASFICWKCRRHSHAQKKKRQILLSIEDHSSKHKKEHENLLPVEHMGNNNTLPRQTAASQQRYMDHLDGQDTSKMTNSIRMAYPNANTLNSKIYHQNHNDIYTNHSLLTTTSTTTGSYLANNNNNNGTASIAIDASNHTPRYHLLTNPDASYYDDLKCSNDQYSSPYKQQQSPMIRRDDPTIPLYATLKPKLLQQQQQQQQQQQLRNNNGYTNKQQTSYSTLHRSAGSSLNTPPLPVLQQQQMLRANFMNHHQLPPPPPPPPVKPKRTFEYMIGNHQHRGGGGADLHSDSGAYLLGGGSSSACGGDSSPHSSAILMDDGTMVDAYGNALTHNRANCLLIYPTGGSSKYNHRQHQTQPRHNNGSTTSLDEEDLDLNDLKDFEDVTFDNLRKPGQQRGGSGAAAPRSDVAPKASGSANSRQKQGDDACEMKTNCDQIATAIMDHKKQQHQLEITQKENAKLNADSEQSLLLKSSSESKSSSSSAASNSSASSTTSTSPSDLLSHLNNPNNPTSIIANPNHTQTTLVNTNYDGSNSTDLNSAGINSERGSGVIAIVPAGVYEETEI